VIEESAMVDTLKIPSPTFQRLRIFSAAKRILRGTASPKDLEAIQKELEDGLSAEDFLGNILPPDPPPEGEGGKPPAKGPSKPAKGGGKGRG
jgi:hypothetical protein